jgi:hypothetical protein
LDLGDDDYTRGGHPMIGGEAHQREGCVKRQGEIIFLLVDLGWGRARRSGGFDFRC